MKKRVAVLISGRGSNMEKLIEGQDHNSEIVVVISDNPDAAGLKIAQKMGVNTRFVDPGHFKTKLSEEAEARYIEVLRSYDVDFIFLAGFMRIIKSAFVQAFASKIINIHPSLLPKYPGLDTHNRVLDAGEQESGCTVHFVDEGIDTGKIIAQAKVAILPDDTANTLAERVLAKEHQLYPMVMRKFCSGELSPQISKILEI